jgi:hypothetical protein
VDIELAIDAIHAPGIKEYQRNKDIDRTLLREPETELKAANADVIQLLDEKHAKAVGTDEPDDQTECDEAQVGTPVSQSVFRMHPALRRYSIEGQVPGTKKAASCEAAF